MGKIACWLGEALCNGISVIGTAVLFAFGAIMGAYMAVNMIGYFGL